jgi:hypothetical protein
MGGGEENGPTGCRARRVTTISVSQRSAAITLGGGGAGGDEREPAQAAVECVKCGGLYRLPGGEKKRVRSPPRCGGLRRTAADVMAHHHQLDPLGWSGERVTSRRSSSFFGTNSTDSTVKPVRLPPGRFKLATSPVSIGSDPVVKTIGIVSVAAFAANTELLTPIATITAT